MNESLAIHYLEDSIASLRAYKKLAEKALAQLNEDEFFITLDEEGNSVAVIMKHIAGNLRSRFTDFLTTDGEKPDRNRDGEFEMAAPASREQLVAWWDAGFATVLASIEALAPEDLDRTVYIRQEAFLALEALNRSATHTAYHVGQIVYLAKLWVGGGWDSLSIPMGQSAVFNARLAASKAVYSATARPQK